MFDKYNLVHFEMIHSLVHSSRERFESIVKAPEFPSLSMDQGFRSPADLSAQMHGAQYRLTGSFDYLLPVLFKESSEVSGEDLLYLQGFCLMDNTADYYTLRENYDSVLLSYTYGGAGALHYQGKDYRLTEGTGFVIDCRKMHQYYCAGSSWKHVDIHFWGGKAERFLDCFHQAGLVSFSYFASEFNRLAEELLDSYTTPSDFRGLYVDSALSGLLCSVLKKTERDGSAGIPSSYRHMLRYMEGNYMHPLSLDDLAERFHVSKYHMSREFRKFTGYAPGEYLIMLRIQHASILLAQSDLSIEAIAMQSGFRNMSNFIGQMKKRTGMTPSEFRKVCKEN